MHQVQQRSSGALARYLSDIRRIPNLSRQQERRLAEQIERGGAAAVNELVESNLGFVVRIANEYREFGVPVEDLLNEGNIGLIEAATRFDRSRGTKFITYAVWWIRKCILKALQNQSNLVRLPNYQVKKAREIQETEASLRHTLGRKPRREEISAELSTELESLDRQLQLSHRIVKSLDDDGNGEERPFAERLEDRSGTSVEQEILRREASGCLVKAMAQLDNRERRVMTARFGLDGRSPRTLTELGRDLGVSRERVRQIELRAKTQLRRLLARDHSIRDVPR